jgi:transposase
MFLRKNYSNKTGRTYLSIVQGYRDTDGKNKHKTIKSVGYLDVLEKEYADPIAHFIAVTQTMDEQRKTTNKIPLTLDMAKRLMPDDVHRKNCGYLVFSKIYHELGLARFLNNAGRHEKFKYNSESIMRLLVYSRLMYPGSKRDAFLNKDLFFDRFDFSLHDVYDGLSHFNKIAEDLQKHLHEQMIKQYDRKTDLIYYDVTNYYFETDTQDELRKRGYSKENRRDPIVQMGLMLDKSSLPVAYKIFPGNTHDSQTLMPMLTEIRKKFGANRIITVADKGLNSGDNIVYSIAAGNGYIFSKSVRGASADFKEWIIDESGYEAEKNGSKIKSKIVPDVVVEYTDSQEGKKKKKKKVKLEQKWVAFYSPKYAARAKHKREEVLAKARKMIANPAQYKSAVDFGAASYIKNLKTDKNTGEILNIEETLLIDCDKITEEEKYDGYYAIITSELDETAQRIAALYKELWHIEESFKITKSVFEARPVYVQTQEHINAHFLICFICLLIGRIAEIRLGKKYTVENIRESLKKVECTRLDENIWLLSHVDEITIRIKEVFDFDFGLKYLKQSEVKNYLARSKL